jgi:hypothetical protein
VSLRIQPLLPSRESDAEDLIRSATEVGIRHVAVEHLKLPVEADWRGSQRLATVLGERVLSQFTAYGTRIGREWILPLSMRIDGILALRRITHETGMTFGAADNDLLLLSDGNCCCSGADLQGFDTHFQCQYTNAARKGMSSGSVTIANIEKEWRPTSTIARFMNSRSRLPTKSGVGAGMWDYLKRNWNGRANGNSPSSLYGVQPTEGFDEQGFRIYSIDDTIKGLLHPRGS